MHDSQGKMVCWEWDISDEDASFVVHAVNCHDELVAMVKFVAETSFELSDEGRRKWQRDARALLAKAEGEGK